MNIRLFTLSELSSMCITKEQLADKMGLNNIPGLQYDCALPEQWLESFITGDMTYPLVVTTTFWVYPEGDVLGRPISGCTEVQESINNRE